MLFAAAAALLAACGQSGAASSAPNTTSKPSAPSVVPHAGGNGGIDVASLPGRITFSDETYVYVVKANGSGHKRLTRGAARDFDPGWSPDGRRIVFRSERDGSSQIYVMNADGTGQRNISKTREDNWGPAWSPDGAWIAFNSPWNWKHSDVRVRHEARRLGREETGRHLGGVPCLVAGREADRLHVNGTGCVWVQPGL